MIFVNKAITARVRSRIEAATGIPGRNVLVSATHTHSGPIVVNYASNADDPIVPKADERFLQRLEDGLVEAAVGAFERGKPAEVGLAVTDGGGVGTNRRDPSGPADPEVPVLMVRGVDGGSPNACLMVYSMHPTVLHEDSTLISGDFPGMTRKHLQGELGRDCVILYHTGPEGNQSPRHVTRANTFAEAERLGELLAARVAQVIPGIRYASRLTLDALQDTVDLPRRGFPPAAAAESALRQARVNLESLRAALKTGAPSVSKDEVRTAECDWFGAEETRTLAVQADSGSLEPYYRSCLPAEIQVFAAGPWRFVAWPGEVFVEYALEVKRASPHTYLINLANGELQGYIPTPQAAEEGGYEASNALFGPESGRIIVDKTLEMLNRIAPSAAEDRRR